MVYRFRPFIFFLVLMIAGGAQSVSAADPIRVVVLPFEVNAPTPQEALSIEIADALKQQLQAEGVAVVEFQGAWKSSGSVMEDLPRIKAIGVEAGADRVIWGTDAPYRHPVKALSWFNELPLSPEDKDRILGLNLLELIGSAG